MRKLLSIIAVLAVAVWLIRTSLFTVDCTEYVYLTQFGKHVGTFDGGNPDEAGLHLKWPAPIQSVQRLDRRLHYFDLPGAELLTHDPRGETIDRTLTVDAYVCWRIAEDGVERFLLTVGTPERAQAILGGRIRSELGAAIGESRLEDLISAEPDRVKKQRVLLHERLLKGGKDRPGAGLEKPARDQYGIELVDIRLRRANHPPAVREAIFDRIRSERNKKAADYQGDGARQAENIKIDAEREVRGLLAEARAGEQRIRGQADAEADRIRNEAQARDPQFYAFLRKLQEYQRILGDGKTLLLLSTHWELFDLLLQPPRPGGSPQPRTTGTGQPETTAKGGK